VHVHGRRVVDSRCNLRYLVRLEEAVLLAIAVETAEKLKQRWSEVRGRCCPT